VQAALAEEGMGIRKVNEMKAARPRANFFMREK
jgi:hypothetical protein